MPYHLSNTSFRWGDCGVITQCGGEIAWTLVFYCFGFGRHVCGGSAIYNHKIRFWLVSNLCRHGSLFLLFLLLFLGGILRALSVFGFVASLFLLGGIGAIRGVSMQMTETVIWISGINPTVGGAVTRTISVRVYVTCSLGVFLLEYHLHYPLFYQTLSYGFPSYIFFCKRFDRCSDGRQFGDVNGGHLNNQMNGVIHYFLH